MSGGAPDDGLDVDSCVEGDDFCGDFAIRSRKGLQGKTPSMPARKIKKEMSPEGRLRPVFRNLVNRHGSSNIVSLIT